MSAMQVALSIATVRRPSKRREKCFFFASIITLNTFPGNLFIDRNSSNSPANSHYHQLG